MAKVLTICAIAGFLGAAVFYSPYIGINAQTPLACPFCPHVLTFWRTPTMRFLRLTFAGGMMNAALFVLIGWIVVKLLGLGKLEN